jgi:hypothetical protein
MYLSKEREVVKMTKVSYVVGGIVETNSYAEAQRLAGKVGAKICAKYSLVEEKMSELDKKLAIKRAEALRVKKEAR